MDNVTHTLAGLLTGELVSRSRRTKPARTLLLVTGVAANNFPDLDLLLTPTLPQPLGYLLMHRGHTHTLIFLLPQALLLTLGFWLCWPRARAWLRDDRRVRYAYLLTLFLGLGLHVAMDFMNSYGVHPFYPFDARWYFGDAVFIVEPLLWATLAGGVVATLGAWARRAWTTVIVGLPLLAAAAGLIPWAAWPATAGVYFGLIALERYTRRGLVVSAVSSVALIASLAALSGRAKARARANAPGEVLDVAASPMPGNPFCWATHVVTRVGETYEVHGELVGLWPISPERCAGGRTVAWVNRVRESVPELKRRAAEDCRFDAWLRFARMPIMNEGEALDVRFSGAGRHNFSTIGLDQKAACPWVPRWARPRQDLLGGVDAG